MNYDQYKRHQKISQCQDYYVAMSLLYEWIKTGVITKKDFIAMSIDIYERLG